MVSGVGADEKTAAATVDHLGGVKSEGGGVKSEGGGAKLPLAETAAAETAAASILCGATAVANKTLIGSYCFYINFNI